MAKINYIKSQENPNKHKKCKGGNQKSLQRESNKYHG